MTSVILRMCHENVMGKQMIVTERWWRKFLLSQAAAFKDERPIKKTLTKYQYEGVTLDSRGTGTYVEQEKRTGKEGRSIQI